MEIKRGMLITARMLFPDQVTIFEQNWPDGAELTLENLNKMSQLGLSINRFANNFLSSPALDIYQQNQSQALEAYEEALATLWGEPYQQIEAVAMRESYQQAIARALWDAIK